MRLFTCTSFTGHYPVGTAAVVVATSEESARQILHMSLVAQGLEGLNADDALEELDTSTPTVHILCDGNY